MSTQDRLFGGEDWEIVELACACGMPPRVHTLLDVQDSIITNTFAFVREI